MVNKIDTVVVVVDFVVVAVVDIVVVDVNVVVMALLVATDHIIVTNPTQPQLNSIVGFDRKMTLNTTTDPPHKLNVINISAVPNPILTKL